LFAGYTSFAQRPEYVRFDDLKFNSVFEKEAFSGIQNGANDYLSLFLAISSQSDTFFYEQINKKILQEIEKLKIRKIDKLAEKKKVALVYELVNKDVLNRYQEQTLFPEIFNSGNFNCLTASAYYGFLFTELNIEFRFKESSNHVHPVAYPSSLQIKVESTDPVLGLQYFDTKLKVQFVNYLLSSKTISKEEATNTSVDEIFNKYYFPESSIGMRELAGLQYLNDAFYNYGKDNFSYALNQIQKAYFLYPSERISIVMLFLLSRCIAETDYKNVEDVSLIAFASRFVGSELKEETITNEFNNLTDKVLFQRSEAVLYDEMFNLLISKMDDSEVRNVIETEYYFQKGRLLLGSFRLKESLLNFEKALLIAPDNIEIQTFAVQSLAFSFSASSNQEIVSTIEEFEKRFPVMKSNEAFISLQMLAYLRLGEEKFDFEKPVEGETLLKKFENLNSLNPTISIHYEKVGDAYSAAAVYFFKRDDINKARLYLNRGLEISPENYQLMYRLRAL
jgi:tetratricopeptide (TPR) repeat protein